MTHHGNIDFKIYHCYEVEKKTIQFQFLTYLQGM
jgi:hypothetical protein